MTGSASGCGIGTARAGDGGRRRGRSHRAAATVTIALTLALAACGGGPVSPGSSAGPTSGAGASAGEPSGGVPEPSAATSSAAVAATSAPPAVAVDPTLLRVLPASVGGLAVTESPEGEAAAEKDASLPTVASAIASGLAIDTATGDFVYAVVVRLLPDAMDDTRFRDWRDSYDEGACSQADGVTGHAETTIGGRTVYIATCGGGVRTYHAWIAGSGLLVSASAVGDERRLGEKLMEALTP